MGPRALRKGPETSAQNFRRRPGGGPGLERRSRCTLSNAGGFRSALAVANALVDRMPADEANQTVPYRFFPMETRRNRVTLRTHDSHP